MNDPVLDRAMFRNQAPVSSYGTGITSNVASPDENARALQMAFQTTGYAGGGQVINGVKHFKKGGDNNISPSTDVGDVLDDYVDTPSESSGLPPNFKFSEPSTSFKSPEVQALYDATLAETGNPNAAMARVLRAYPNEMMMASPPPVPGPRGGGFRPAAPRFTPTPAPGPLPPRFVPGTLASQPAGGPPPVVAAPAAGGARYPSPPAAPSQMTGSAANAGRTMAGVLAPAAVATAAGIPSLGELRGMAERSRDRLDNPPEAAPEAPAIVQRPLPPQTGLFPGFRPKPPTPTLTPEQVDAKNLASFTEESASVPTAKDLQDPRYKRIGTSVYDYFFGGKTKPTAGVGAVEAKPPAAAAPTAETSAAAAAPPLPPKKPEEESGISKRLTLRIDELKQEREANKAQRRENQLLSLMQAGFAAAAGKSSSAITNIGAGGAAGIATLADLEKTRRAEDTSLRKEGLELELAKEKLIESAKERAAARDERGLSRDITGLRAVADANKGLVISYENQILTLERLQDVAGLPDEKKKEYGQLIAQKQAEVDRLRLEYKQQAQGLLPKGMKSPNLDFPTEVLSSSPTRK